METIRTKEMNGHQVVVGLDRLDIDPEGTKARAKELLYETDVYKEYLEAARLAESTKNAIAEKIAVADREVQAIEAALNLGDYPPALRIPIAAQASKESCEKYLKALAGKAKVKKVGLASMAQVSKNIQDITVKVNAEHKRIREENPVYFEPRAGEIIPSKGQIAKLRKALETLGEDEALTPVGKKIKVQKLPNER